MFFPAARTPFQPRRYLRDGFNALDVVLSSSGPMRNQRPGSVRSRTSRNFPGSSDGKSALAIAAYGFNSRPCQNVRGPSLWMTSPAAAAPWQSPRMRCIRKAYPPSTPPSCTRYSRRVRCRASARPAYARSFPAIRFPTKPMQYVHCRCSLRHSGSWSHKFSECAP